MTVVVRKKRPKEAEAAVLGAQVEIREGRCRLILESLEQLGGLCSRLDGLPRLRLGVRVRCQVATAA